MMTDRQIGYLAGLEAARTICDQAVLAWRHGAGSDHSAEARKVGIAQAEWIAGEIHRLSSGVGEAKGQQ